jgi:Holliday junction resolvasome RuvABC endonuclease subunit
MIKFIRKLIEIVTNYDTIKESQDEYIRKRFKTVNDKVDGLMEEFKKLNSINVDVGYREPSVVITIGRYKGRDHVEVKYITHASLEYLIDEVKAMERIGIIKRIDATKDVRQMMKQRLNIDKVFSGDNYL